MVDIRAQWLRMTQDENGTAGLVACSPGEATNVLVSKAFFGVLMRAWAKDDHEITEPRKIGMRYNTQCPDCGFVAEGFDSEKEAAKWRCDQCQPSLPLEGDGNVEENQE